MESLIKAGAFDSMGYTRRSLMAIMDEAVDAVVPLKRNESAGQFDLFAGLGSAMESSFSVQVPSLEEWDKSHKLNEEREMLGLYVSDHPLSDKAAFLSRASDATIVQLLDDEAVADGQSVTIAGLISSVQTRIAKKSGKTWATATIEDLTGSTGVNIFTKTYERVAPLLMADSLVVLHARVSIRDGAVQLNATDIELAPAVTEEDAPVNLQVPERACTRELMAKLAEVLQQYPGDVPVRLHVLRPDSTSVVELNERYAVKPDSAFYSDVKVVLGRDSVLS
jgi:DNA polymerase-3 subunit alpha